MKNFQPNFSHIYIEESAKNYPLSKLAIEKFSKSTIIEINHYKDVFNRPNQDFQIQNHRHVLEDCHTSRHNLKSESGAVSRCSLTQE